MENNCQPLRELSLFTGAGGGILGSMLLGHRIVGAVEFNEYCCQVLEQRQRDGILERFPIFNTDIRDFIRNGYADLYKGHCDLISAGFPCQPFSVAGKRAGADDARNMWPATIATIRAVRPRYCLLENVPGLLTSGYFGTILGDLAESGYDARWRILSAAELGAPHLRDRLWIVANAAGRAGELQPRQRQDLRDELADLCVDVADAASARLEGTAGAMVQSRSNGLARGSWWQAEPALGRVANGVASRVDRLKAIGNGQVPAVVRAAWHLLTEVTN